MNDVLIALKDGGILDVISDSESYGGCPTCDYGSNYIRSFDVSFVNHPTLKFGVSAMYAYALSEDFVIKLFTRNVVFA